MDCDIDDAKVIWSEQRGRARHVAEVDVQLLLVEVLSGLC